MVNGNDAKVHIVLTLMLAIAAAALVASGLSSAYAQEALEANPSSATVVDITDPKQTHRITADFQRRLTELGSDRTVTSCDPLIQYYGPVTNTPRRASSFGAACVLSGKERPIHVVMCDDFMIGKFSLGPPGSANKERLIRFTKDNCPPGG
jgi:hypothetical protein